ncbi:hypothetical protein SLINC_3050 [Streptomyces lincolnensis]|uniref:Uncharacterized protein n=1 Tax=Streptomyces lincolnensis TaxID=1915 RepID=A0A1B1M9U5_STRLN|nr:hypothetical protein [Streptomyces lincolnensis]ANS65274.1 hypothetical protein SLINC_3050 [Streptomyces lincolnensis]AXG56518.1 hypothetical protein SLCG_5363 [Streptomyces lincolnensis]QMV07045.1 hypothetical protein GJU35_16070 [Streptomyces lincolnensis]
MAEIERECPTCRSRQTFRMLNEAEKAAVREDKGARHYVGNLWRCTAKGCLWYQPYLHTRGGGLLPEEFREKEATAQEGADG